MSIFDSVLISYMEHQYHMVVLSHSDEKMECYPWCSVHTLDCLMDKYYPRWRYLNHSRNVQAPLDHDIPSLQ